MLRNALRDRLDELGQVALIGEQLVDVHELAFPQSNSPKIFRSPISKPDGTEEGNFVGQFLDEYQKQKN